MYRAAGQAFVELALAPREQVGQLRIVQAVAHAKVWLAADFGVAVPRAGKLTVVAAVDAVADQRPQFQRNRTFQFDGQVRNAAPRIELVGPDDRARGTDVDALRAAAAMLPGRSVRWQRQVGIDLSQEEIRPGLAR